MRHQKKKIIIILILIVLLVSLMIIDYSDINEKFGFPINVIDEPLLVVSGVILGYFLAKFKFIKTRKEK